MAFSPPKYPQSWFKSRELSSLLWRGGDSIPQHGWAIFPSFFLLYRTGAHLPSSASPMEGNCTPHLSGGQDSYFLVSPPSPWPHSMDAPTIRQFNRACVPHPSKPHLEASKMTQSVKALTAKPGDFEFSPRNPHGRR